MLSSLTPRSMSPLALASLLLVFACSDDGADGDGGAGSMSTEPVSFAADIHPILLVKCSGSSCHGVSMGPYRPGHAVADVDQAYMATQQLGLNDQPVYERMLARTTSTDSAQIMPPSYATPLTSGELALIRAWVAQGAPP